MYVKHPAGPVYIKDIISVIYFKVLLLNQSDTELRILKNNIEKDKNIRVIGIARNNHEARNMVKALNPDIILMDILAPQSGGINFLKRLYQFCPKPVIIVSNISKMSFCLVISILKAGAVDIIDKNALIFASNIHLSRNPLLSKIKINCGSMS